MKQERHLHGQFVAHNPNELGLTAKQAKFVIGVAKGLSNVEAARYAGYADVNAEAYRLMRHSGILEALRTRREAQISGNMAQTALRTLSDLMDDPKTPAATKYNVARYTLELAGHTIQDDKGSDKPLEDMNPAELAHAITSGMSALTELAGKMDGHHIIDGTPMRIKDVHPVADESVIDMDDLLN